MTVRKAVIPAAGLGTRFLPATKVVPKEMLHVVDRPGIQYAVEELARVGIEDIVLITSRGKSLIEDHFDVSPELESALESKGKLDELKAVRAIAELASIYSVRQKEPLGLGHAVATARDHIGDEPFVVVLPDEVVPEPVGDEPSLLSRMLAIHEERNASVVAVREVAEEEVSSYGIVAPGEVDGDVVAMTGFVEKPDPSDAPSRLASVGRYVLTPGIFSALETTEPGAGGEIQLTDAIRAVSEREGAFAYVYPGPIFDVGKKLDHLKASIEIALRREDLAQPLRGFLTELLSKG